MLSHGIYLSTALKHVGIAHARCHDREIKADVSFLGCLVTAAHSDVGARSRTEKDITRLLLRYLNMLNILRRLETLHFFFSFFFFPYDTLHSLV